jgi:3-isopropylmalate/(R)-2-methylmalate dehydratase large subunit
MTPRTISEKILSAKCCRPVAAGDFVIAPVDCIVGTDASSPMAFDYFRQLGAAALHDPARVFLSLDHYAPPTTLQTLAFHDEVRAFVARYGGTLFEVGDGISHQILVDRHLVHSGDLVIGADSHIVTCGARNLMAIGVGSLDLAAAMATGEIWLTVPETIRIRLTGSLAPGVSAKDVGLALIGELGPEGANYKAIEFVGVPFADGALSPDDMLVLCNLAVEMGAKAAICPGEITADAGARYCREIDLDVGALTPRVARPHAPHNVVPLAECVGTPIQMVFLGTCTGGRVADFHQALAVLERGGGTIAPGVQLVVTPASRDVERVLMADGTLPRLVAMGAKVTTAGCGACCGTSGVIPADHTNVVSTANRNFKARMGSSAAIYLASPAACAAAALTGALNVPDRDRG